MKVDDYLKSRCAIGGWKLEGCCEVGFDGAVVIPALAESANLKATLSSLACCPVSVLQRFLIVIVVNHRSDAGIADQADNLEMLEQLPLLFNMFPSLKLAWVDAASPGRELPLKHGGVGMARKIGCDLALSRLNISPHSLLICLDADTIVRPDYLTALEKHFMNTREGAAIIPFLHQPSPTPEGKKAIERYELFLRSYVYGLGFAGSPYAFHTVGSAMACRVVAYLKIGGMNCRQAGEDFYFLQQLFRTVGVSMLRGTVVYPSSRASHRVPFGTGRAVSQALNDEKQSFLFYHYSCYCILRNWLSVVNKYHDECSCGMLALAAEISPQLVEYLEGQRFAENWQKLQRHNPEPSRFIKAFHDWFDGLKTMKLIHHLSSTLYPRCEPDVALPNLFAQCGIALGQDIPEQLEQLRKLQLGSDYETAYTIEYCV